MSGILNKLKGREKLFIFVLGLICCWIIFIAILVNVFALTLGMCLKYSFGCIILGLIVLVFNMKVRLCVLDQVSVFQPSSQIRNVDLLIIGDMYKPEELELIDKTSVHIYAPNRTFGSSYQILRHTFSILKEGGTAVIAVKKSNLHSDIYSIWDIPFLHEITIKKNNLYRLKKCSRFPLIFKPLASIRMFIGFTRGYKECECPVKEVVDFCAERSINLVCKVKEN